MNSITVSLTSAQLKALRATPVVIVPAQGANTLIVPISASWQYIPGATAYTVPINYLIHLVYTADTTTFGGVIPTAGGTLDMTTLATKLRLIDPQLSHSNTKAQLSNIAIQTLVTGATSEMTLGDGTLRITIGYQVNTLA